MQIISKTICFITVFYLALTSMPRGVNAQRVHEESNGFVAMEMENTDSPLGRWGFIDTATAAADSTYPTGAVGTGHLEYQGPFTNPTPGSTLDYFFKINQTGSYELRLRAHKRLLGNEPDKNNDAFVKLTGNFTSGNPNVPQSALENNTKLFGGSDSGWGFARRLDGNGAHLEEAIYNLQAGETYQLSISGRSTRFNVDRIIIVMDLDRFTFNQLQTLPESNILPEILLGDVDLSGAVDFLDIPPLISILQAGGYLAEADVNQDGFVDFSDIGPFINKLLNL